MKSTAKTIEEYLDELPEVRRVVIEKLRTTILNNLPAGFSEEMNYGMIGYIVPLATYPAGYHCSPNTPLPSLNITSQKNFVGLYHMGIYANKELDNWFVSEFSKYSKGKLDMGKSCIRFKNMNDIPFELIGKLVSKVSPDDWVEQYEKVLKR